MRLHAFFWEGGGDSCGSFLVSEKSASVGVRWTRVTYEQLLSVKGLNWTNSDVIDTPLLASLLNTVSSVSHSLRI